MPISDRDALCMQTRRLGLSGRMRRLSFVAGLLQMQMGQGMMLRHAPLFLCNGNTSPPVHNFLLKIACIGQPIHPRLLRGLLRLLTWRPCRPGCICNKHCAASSLTKRAHSAGERQVLTCSSLVPVGMAMLLLRANTLQGWTERTRLCAHCASL